MNKIIIPVLASILILGSIVSPFTFDDAFAMKKFDILIKVLDENSEPVRNVECVVSDPGSGIIVSGFTNNGGVAKVMLEGEISGDVDVTCSTDTHEASETVTLKEKGTTTVKLVLRILACIPTSCEDLGFADCSGTCRDTSTDEANCGSCGSACPSGEFCVTGTCESGSSCTPSPEVCNGLDDNCDGIVDNADLDGDGFVDIACGGTDCDDSRVEVFLGNPELCDGLDNDCNGVVDDKDFDMDGAIDSSCVLYTGLLPVTDCDEKNRFTFGGSTEFCDGIDNNCDGVVDENDVCLPDPRCGDGITSPLIGEECDSGAVNSDTCDADCTLPVCGDGLVNLVASETCDDGNTTSGDGCSSTCQTEGGECAGEDAGTACGDSTNDSCTNPDTCDGSGNCLPNDEAPGTACGDQGVQCVVDDTCDGAGSCTDNGFDDGAGCDDDNACTVGDFCIGGVCSGDPLACLPGDVCNPATGVCVSDSVETDLFPSSTIQFELLRPDGTLELISLSGTTTIEATFDGLLGSATDTDGNGLDQVPIEIVSMSLTGNSPTFGPVSMTLNPFIPSTGQIEEQTNNNPGLLDLQPFAPGNADAFFGVFVEFSFGLPPINLSHTESIILSSTISFKPVGPGEIYSNSGGFTDLRDENGNPTGFFIGGLDYTPEPSTCESDIDCPTALSCQFGFCLPL